MPEEEELNQIFEDFAVEKPSGKNTPTINSLAELQRMKAYLNIDH